MGAWEARITQLKHETYEDEDAWETMLAGQLRFLMDVIDGTGAPVTDGAMTRLADLKAEWQTRQEELRRISDEHMRPINTWAQQQGVDLRARALEAAPGCRAFVSFQKRSALLDFGGPLLSVESKLGEGAYFTVLLPAAELRLNAAGLQSGVTKAQGPQPSSTSSLNPVGFGFALSASSRALHSSLFVYSKS